MLIDSKDKVLTHLLGYLTEEQWREAGGLFQPSQGGADVLTELAGVQDDTYGTNHIELING